MRRNLRQFALGRLKAGEMNKTEAAYELVLRARQHEGSVLWYRFEALTFRLAARTSYTPDFIVLRDDGQLEAHEVKGYWQDDARAKIKIAAEMFPLQFIAVKKGKGGAWEHEKF